MEHGRNRKDYQVLIEKLLEFKLAYEVFGIAVSWGIGILFIIYLLIEFIKSIRG